MNDYGPAVELDINPVINDAAIDRELDKLDKKAKSKGGGLGDRMAGLFDSKNLAGVAGGIVGGQGGAGAAGQIGGMVGEAFLGPIGAAIGGALGPALEKAAPGAMHNLSVVFDDVSAVIGRTFIPVIETITPLLRMGADILATILPDAGEMKEALAPLAALMGEMGSDVKSMWNSLAPILHGGLIFGLQVLAKTIEYVSIPMRFLAAVVAEVADAFTDGAKNIRSSTGAAAQRASFQGFGAYQQQLQQASFSIPGGATVASMPGDIQSIRVWVKEEMGPAIKEVVGFLKVMAGNPINDARKSIEEGKKEGKTPSKKAREDTGDFLWQLFTGQRKKA